MKMHAVGYRECLPVDDPNSLIDLEFDRPTPFGRDLLVEIRAVSVNPVDVKQRVREKPADGPRILGFDGAGIVVATGAEARLFRPGDAVYYAGSVRRSGTNAQFHLVDERIVGRKPGNISFAEAAALPLTTLTASELLFDRIGVAMGAEADRRSLLVIGGAGGVGSIAIQIARRLTGLTVIATASRTHTRDWCLAMGAHHVIDHSQPMQPQLAAAGFADVDIVLSLTASDRHLPEIAAIIAPQGRVGVIDDIKGFDITAFKTKSVSIHWEYMFVRPVFGTHDIEEQHRILDRTAALVENGQLRSTLGEIVGPLDAAHLRTAHRLVESGKACGKIVLEASGM
jgi:zinc-binding alcohol dehydrogenase family protein